MVGKLVEGEWRTIAEQLGNAAYLHTLILTDPDSFANLIKKRDFIDKIIGEFLMTKTKKEIYETVQPWRIPTTPIHTIKDVIEDPQLKARSFFVDIEHPELGAKIKYPGTPYRLSETPSAISRRAPLIGEHNHEIYELELEMSEKDIAELKIAGVI